MPKIRIKDGTAIIAEHEIAKVERAGNKQFEINLGGLHNTSKDIKINYQIFQDGNILVEKIFDLVVHGPKRNNFVIVQSVDGDKRKLFSLEEPDSDGLLEHDDYSIDTQFNIHYFHDEVSKPSLVDEDNQSYEIEPNADNMFQSKTKELIAAFDSPRSEIYLEAMIDSRGRSFNFKSEKAGRGEFTFEEQFLNTLLTCTSKDQLDSGYQRFGERSVPYTPGDVTPRTQSRRYWAKIMEKHEKGYHPVIVDLIGSSSGEAAKKDFIWSSIDGFNLSPQLESIKDVVNTYVESRTKVLEYLRSLLDSESKYPLYATSVVFSKHQEQLCEAVLLQYLDSYKAILDKVESVTDWDTKFFLLHLDTVVHYDEENAFEPDDHFPFFLLGPLHPLVLIKRFYVQRALYLRADRYISEPSKDKYRHFVPLLSHTYALRWIPSVRIQGDSQLKHAYVCSTSDPGWHFAFKYPNEQFVHDAKRALYDHHGMYVVLSESTNDTAIATYLKDYLKSYPSKRAISVKVNKGHEPTKIVQNIDSLIHTQSKKEEKSRKRGICFLVALRSTFKMTISRII